MAGAGYKLFNTGDVLTAAQVNTYLMEQTVMVFANAAARTTALSGVVSEGMISYLKDTNAVEVYDGSNWVSSDDPNAIQNTIVDAKGDLITATASDVPARLAVGNNGETLVADSSASTGLRYIPYGSINFQINGGMDIWQRGTSVAVGAAFSYTADRWLGWRNALASGMTVSRQTSDLDGFQYYARLQRDSGNTSTQTLFFGSSLETQVAEMLQGQFVTLSFYARAGANYSGGTFDSYIFTGTGTDQSISALSTNAGSLGNSLTSSWARFSVTTTSAIASSVTSLGIRFQYAPSGTAGANDYVDIAGVQLELGRTATPFRRSGGTLAGELAAAMRYYEKSYDQATALGTATNNGASAGTRASGGWATPIRFAVTKRSTPTVTVYSTATGTSARIRNRDAGTDEVASASDIGQTGLPNVSGTGGTAGVLYTWQWEASAEL